MRIIVRQIITRLTAVKCKLQKLHARITGILYELQYRRSQESKILCNNRTVAKPLLDRIHDIHARPRHPFAVCRRRIAVRDRKILVKAAEMINPHDVIQLKACCQSLQPPLIPCLFMIIPAIQRIAPELSGSCKSIRRASCHCQRCTVLVKLEQFRIRPCICTVKCNVDRNITDDLDTFFIGILFQFLPLFCKFILLKTDKIHLFF